MPPLKHSSFYSIFPPLSAISGPELCQRALWLLNSVSFPANHYHPNTQRPAIRKHQTVAYEHQYEAPEGERREHEESKSARGWAARNRFFSGSPPLSFRKTLRRSAGDSFGEGPKGKGYYWFYFRQERFPAFGAKAGITWHAVLGVTMHMQQKVNSELYDCSVVLFSNRNSKFCDIYIIMESLSSFSYKISQKSVHTAKIHNEKKMYHNIY